MNFEYVQSFPVFSQWEHVVLSATPSQRRFKPLQLSQGHKFLSFFKELAFCC